MTADFIDSEFESSPSYPTVFGLTLTPLVSGALMGLAGIVGAGAIVTSFVMPALETYQSLDAKVKEKSEQLQQQAAVRKQIQTAKDKLEQAKQQRDQVYALFSTEKSLSTLLFDINQLIERNNAGLTTATNAKLNSCPVYVRQLFATPHGSEEFQDKFGELVAKARLRKFKPSEKGAEVINDGSLGELINNKLKRQTIEVEFRGNFNQTQSIFRTIERLQPLLLIRNLDVKVVDSKVSEGLYEVQRDGTVRYLTNCQPDIQVTTAFQMDALLPLTDVDRKALQPSPSPSPSPGK